MVYDVLALLGGPTTMFDWVKARNFRNLQNIDITGLSQVNLISGKNNSGKTSVLEALFFLFGTGNPQMALNTNVVRNINLVGRVDPSSGVLSVMMREYPWKELFFGLDIDRQIEISGCHSSRAKMSLKITADLDTEVSMERSESSAVTNSFDKRSLTFRYSESDKDPIESYVRFTPQGIDIQQASAEPFPSVIVLARGGDGAEDAARLGKLRQQKQAEPVLDALKIIDRRLQSLEEISVSGVPTIWGDIGLPELVPLSVMGEGMIKLARLVLAISSAQEGVLLVDEIENGFHHSVLPDVWRVIEQAAGQFGVQVFATTHSYECVTAAQATLKDDHFRYHRLEVVDSTVRCKTYPPDAIAAAIRHDLEIR